MQKFFEDFKSELKAQSQLWEQNDKKGSGKTMIKLLLFPLVIIMFTPTLHAENNSKLTYLDEDINIMSLAATKNIAIVSGRKTVADQSMPAIYISKKIGQWKELKLPQSFEVNNYSYGEVTTQKEWFYLSLKKKSGINKPLFLMSKDGVNWNKAETLHKYRSTWGVIESYKISKEKIQVLWDGSSYMLYNSDHQLPIPVWQSITSVDNLALDNVTFNSYCVTKEKMFISHGASGGRGPTPIAYSSSLYHWKYPTLLRPDSKSGNKIYRLSCLKDGTVVGTGNSDGVFFDNPNIRGMIIYSNIDKNGNISWERKFTLHPINDGAVKHRQLFTVGWNKNSRAYFFGEKPLPQKMRDPKIAVNDRAIIASNNLIYEEALAGK